MKVFALFLQQFIFLKLLFTAVNQKKIFKFVKVNKVMALLDNGLIFAQARKLLVSL